MKFTCHHLDKFEFINFDLIQEVIAKKNKCIVLIGGASSSGKSFCASALTKILKNEGYRVLTLSSDAYNKGISGIITDKVNLNFFDGKLDSKKIANAISDELAKTPFDEKFNDKCCEKLTPYLKKVLNNDELDKFIESAKVEIKKLNFDEPSVYDLSSVSDDLKKFLANGKIKKKEYSKITSEQVKTSITYDCSNYDILILEGIYVLSDNLYNSIDKSYVITNFIQGSPKSLFLRRVIRDNKHTSAPSYFTINMYFNNIVPSYQSTILPSAKNADVTFSNEMTFAELRDGNLYITKEKKLITNPLFLEKFLSEAEIVDIKYQKDYYFNSQNGPHDDNNQLRLREISEDYGKTYTPTSLIHKGAPKARKDGIEIRPINILLKEGEFFKAFNSTEDFLNKLTFAGFTIDKIVQKVKRYLNYKGKKFTLSSFSDGQMWIEFSDSTISNKLKAEIIKLIEEN